MSIRLVGNGLLGTLLAVETVQRDYAVVVTGAVMAAYSLGFIAGSLRCVALIGRAGHIRTFAALASVASASALAHSLFDYIVYDLDAQRIVDFRLKPWADRFLTIRAGIYELEEAGKEKYPPFQETGTGMPPRGFEPLFQP